VWLITPFGFFSIVQKPDDKTSGRLTVRARVASDLERLRAEYLPTLGPIIEGAGTDYRYRATAPRGDVAVAFANVAMSIGYANFKDEVATRQGKSRAAIYAKVWDVLFGLKDDAKSSVTPQAKPRASHAPAPAGKAHAYGGIVLDGAGRVLLRRPRGDYDGYVWTFPKGRPDRGETAEEAALREVREETGYSATINTRLPGSFAGGVTVTEYFIMTASGVPGDFDKETAAIRWASLDEAESLIGLTTNARGRQRDLDVLAAVRSTLRGRAGHV
jgi:8-oxo-dGTP pyrophosphatase MutT (NUDIX family)